MKKTILTNHNSNYYCNHFFIWLVKIEMLIKKLNPLILIPLIILSLFIGASIHFSMQTSNNNEGIEERVLIKLPVS